MKSEAQFDFNSVAKEDRVIVGFVAHCAVRALCDKSDPSAQKILTKIEAQVSPKFIEKIRLAVAEGPEGGAVGLLTWHRPGDQTSETGLRAALERIARRTAHRGIE